MFSISAEIQIKAPIQKVWDYITHHDNMDKWPRIDAIKVEKQGAEHPDGVGSIRELTVGKNFFREVITGFDVPNRVDYEVTDTSLPIEHKGGYISLKYEDSLTHVEWRSIGSIQYKNPIKRRIIAKMFKQASEDFQANLDWIKRHLEG